MKSAVSNRRNLTPPTPGNAATDDTASPAGGVHLMRRGGARREVSARVFLKNGSGVCLHEGWALNVSRGGVRAILEEKIDLGQEFDVDVGDPGDQPSRRGRIVWVQEEPDGVIVGIEFVGLSGTHKSAPPPAPDATDATEATDLTASAAPDATAVPAASPPDDAEVEPRRE